MDIEPRSIEFLEKAEFILLNDPTAASSAKFPAYDRDLINQGAEKIIGTGDKTWRFFCFDIENINDPTHTEDSILDYMMVSDIELHTVLDILNHLQFAADMLCLTASEGTVGFAIKQQTLMPSTDQ